MCNSLGEIPGNVHGFGESELGQGRRSSDKQEKRKGKSLGSHSGPDTRMETCERHQPRERQLDVTESGNNKRMRLTARKEK